MDGVGLNIQWQDGPLGRGPDRKIPNGAFVETVLNACLIRLQWYERTNGGKFSCLENQQAIESIEHALNVLEDRTHRRESSGTEGTRLGS